MPHSCSPPSWRPYGVGEWTQTRFDPHGAPASWITSSQHRSRRLSGRQVTRDSGDTGWTAKMAPRRLRGSPESCLPMFTRVGAGVTVSSCGLAADDRERTWSAPTVGLIDDQALGEAGAERYDEDLGNAARRRRI